MGEYRLDAKEVAFGGGLSVPNIVAGKSEDSPLFQRVAGLGKLNPMPMVGERLKPHEVALIKAWIDQGAAWPDDVGVKTRRIEKHWAYVKPARPQPPTVSDNALIRNPMDNFVLARLNKEGLTFEPEASKETLIRRVSLDLRGLPPTIKEIDRFLADTRPNSYDLLIDRMLNDSSFGEHWAQQWLDLARYADTNGYESDEPRTMWAYRDWVVDALNRNLPFDQFTIEQLAGDLITNATPEQIVATGFHRNTMVNNEAGSKDDEFRDAAVKDRVDTTATVWLGSTLGCAQCHDHKYDPFKQSEYYQLYAIFNNTAESSIKVSEEMPIFKGDKAELKRREDRVASLNKILEGETPALKRAQVQWEQRMKSKLDAFNHAWQVLQPAAMHSESGAILEKQDDGSVLVKEGSKSTDVLELEFKTGLQHLSGFRIEALPAERAAKGSLGKSQEHFFLSDVEAEAWSPDQIQQQTSRWAEKLQWGPWRTIGPFRTNSRAEAFANSFPPETNQDPQVVYENGHLAWIKRPWRDGRVHYFRYLPDTPEENCAHYAFRTVEAKEATNVTVSVGSFKGLKLWLNGELVLSTDPTREIAPDQEMVQLLLREGKNEILIKGSNDEGPYGFFFRPYVGLEEKAHVRLAAATVDRSEWESIDLPEVFDGLKESGWEGDGRGGALIIQATEPLGSEAGTHLKLRLIHDLPEGSSGSLQHFRISATTMEPSQLEELRQMSGKIRMALASGSAERTSEEARAVQDHYRSISPELAGTRKQYKKLRSELEDFRKHHSTSTLVMRELPEPRETHRQNRGSFLDPAEAVEPGVPSVLHPIDRQQKINRLAFARWLMDRDNPLTARVRVNQIWLNVFGQGLVTTSEDFGTQGEPPSHPELLDWLATEFIRLRWDTKALLKTIVTSATYRQASEVTPEKHEKDPGNKLLSRGARYRLSGETVRDVGLAASSLLSRKIGGPSVFPPQPSAVFADHFIEGGFKQWPTSAGEDRYRRGLYTFYKRTLVYPTFSTFDGPDRTVCTVKRSRSNTPLQALDTLNDPVFFEAAGGLARRILTEASGNSEERLAYGFRLVLGRRPTEVEKSRILDFKRKMEARYRAPQETEKIIAAAFPAEKPAANQTELSAWIMVANALLNIDEAVSRE